MLLWVVSGIGLAAVGGFAAVIARFNLKRVGVMRAAAQIAPDQLEAIYTMVEGAGPEPSGSYMLGRTNLPAPDAGDAIELPGDIGDVPWAGQQVVVQADGEDVSFRIAPRDGHGTRLGGRTFRAVRVPQERGKPGKPRRIFSPTRYIAASPGLKDALESAFPGDPQGLLGYLLCPGRDSFELDATFQARIAGSPAWVRSAESPKCERCRQRMQLIVQLPGGMVAGGQHGEATFYLFGCASHPDVTRTIAQRT